MPARLLLGAFLWVKNGSVIHNVYLHVFHNNIWFLTGSIKAVLILLEVLDDA